MRVPGPTREHARKVIMLARRLRAARDDANINTATARVLDAVGVQSVIVPKAGCCGAVKFHLNDQEGGKAEMRANIDAWWPLVEQGGVEAIVMNASGCGVTVKEYGHLLKDDAQYAAKAERISALTRDLSELLPAMLPELAAKLQGRVSQPDTLYAYHPPAPLQHGQKLRGGVESHLNQLGFKLRAALRNDAPVLRLCGHVFGAEPRTVSPAARPQTGRAERSLRRAAAGHDPFWPTSAASPTCKAALARRYGTGWKCWTKP